MKPYYYANKNPMDVFSFTLPTEIVYGPGVLARLPQEMKRLGCTRPVIITDAGVFKAGIAEQVKALVADAGYEFVVYSGVEANPKDVNCEECAEMARAFGADSLIAVGGGSPIDCAKAVGVLLAHNADKIKPYEGKTAATKPQVPLIAIPTTSGTGSELTFSAVITDTANHYKMTVKSPFTAAKLALCDPELTVSVPPMVTASTGVDALTHAIEGYTTKAAWELADCLNLEAIRLISRHLRSALVNDAAGREGMALGQFVTGMAFSNVGLGIAHSMAHTLGAVYDTPHGVACAMMLPIVMEYNAETTGDKFKYVAEAMGVDTAGMTPAAYRAAAIEAVRQLSADVGIPRKLEALKESDLDFLAESAYADACRPGNPRETSVEDLKNLFRKLM